MKRTGVHHDARDGRSWSGATSRRSFISSPGRNTSPRKSLTDSPAKPASRSSYEVYDSNEAMLSKLGRLDEIRCHPAVGIHRRASDQARHAGGLDPAQIPNIANLLPEYRNFPFDPGNQYSVPYMAGTVGIIVNTEKIKEPIAGIQGCLSKQVFETDHRPGRQSRDCVMGLRGSGDSHQRHDAGESGEGQADAEGMDSAGGEIRFRQAEGRRCCAARWTWESSTAAMPPS